MSSLWKVVGGADKGGILVRMGIDLKAPQEKERLSTGAVILQLALKGERLKYKLLSGTGPPQGWVSTKISGKELVDKIPLDPIDLKALEERSNQDNEQYTYREGMECPPEWEGLTPPPPRGKFVPEPTGKPQAGKEWTPRLPKVPKRLRKITPFEAEMRAKPQKEVAENLDKLGDEGPIGYFFGLKIPYTLELLHRYGLDHLTEMLHAAGTLPEDNKIVKMDIEDFVGGSMSLKCFLYLEYEKPDPELHKALFMKYPFPCVSAHERRATYISRFLLNNDGPEMDFARILSPGAPVKSPKYYFGDINTKTGLAILITEKLPLAKHSEEIGPYELESIPYKSVDYTLDKPFHYYDQMTRNIARLAAWGKIGKLGQDIEEVFPPPAHPPAYFMTIRKRLDEWLLPTIYERAPWCVPEEITGKKGSVREDEWMVATMQQILPEVEKYQALILDYLFAKKDYGGFTHQNMNTDNAMFWRDEEGNVLSGFIDWGRFKRDNFARGLSNGFMCSDLVEMVQLSDQQWIKNFISEFIAEGGPLLEFDVFWEHYMLSWLLQGLPAVDLPRQLTMTGSPHAQPDGLKKLTTYKDPRIFRLPQYNNGMFAILRNFVYYWRCRDLPAFWEQWKNDHIDETVTPPKLK